MTNGITYLLHCSRYQRTMILNLLRLINDHACGGGKTKRGGWKGMVANIRYVLAIWRRYILNMMIWKMYIVSNMGCLLCIYVKLWRGKARDAVLLWNDEVSRGKFLLGDIFVGIPTNQPKPLSSTKLRTVAHQNDRSWRKSIKINKCYQHDLWKSGLFPHVDLTPSSPEYTSSFRRNTHPKYKCFF